AQLPTPQVPALVHVANAFGSSHVAQLAPPQPKEGSSNETHAAPHAFVPVTHGPDTPSRAPPSPAESSAAPRAALSTAGPATDCVDPASAVGSVALSSRPLGIPGVLSRIALQESNVARREMPPRGEMGARIRRARFNLRTKHEKSRQPRVD